MRKNIASLAALAPFSAFAQTDNIMYSEGKIYVVIAVVAIIFIGLAVFLMGMDKRIKKLENEK
ncbi:MAG TPA: CcmD family protein [Cryomorphaceae bacterium]|jgi:hypothetical protein|nr:hypothetical protein [Schleiferiaceae bacterium]HBB81629.1 CcmD family protein [Cryomorphaceae bacterium]HCY25277.1 CcmD family protein [Cryomorphaceae bacterium]|tara:strand:+ start:782 stop:970 length:189 start_codon:yes stop_codon:yes gene_type:complete